MIISNVLKPEEEVQPVPYDDSQLEISEEAASESTGGEVEDLENELGEQLSSMLNQMDGVSETEVMINLEATSEQVYEKNRTTGKQTTDETDRNGGSRVVEDQTDDHRGRALSPGRSGNTIIGTNQTAGSTGRIHCSTRHGKSIDEKSSH